MFSEITLSNPMTYIFKEHVKIIKIYMLKFEPLMYSNKTIMEVENITKATTFESFPHLSCKNMQLLFFVAVIFNIFMRKTVTQKYECMLLLMHQLKIGFSVNTKYIYKT